MVVTNEPSKAWVSDITCIPVQEGFLYLTSVIDLFDRKLVGWSISQNMKAETTVIPAFNMAVKKRHPERLMIFHSDRGSQYASKKMVNLLASYDIRQSMSRKGNCWNNVVAESFFKNNYGLKYILLSNSIQPQIRHFIKYPKRLNR